MDFVTIIGHAHAKRAVEVAVAGGHHLLIVGPPGLGKTMLVQAAAALLPDDAPRAALTITTTRRGYAACHVGGAVPCACQRGG